LFVEMSVPSSVRGERIVRRQIWNPDPSKLAGAGRLAVDAVRNTVRARRYPLPALRTRTAQTHPPTIYYATPDFNVPSGGVRVAYRHVDLLNEAGIPAAILHRRTGFRCTWFENRTRVVASADTLIEPHDLVVVGELAVSLLADLPGGFRYVVFNQNPHLTWKRATPEMVRAYVESRDLAAMLTVSDHGLAALQHAAPGANVLRMHNSVDPRLFFPGTAGRGRTIAYMPRRGREEAGQVLGILRGRGALDGWQLDEIDNLTEHEVAERLRGTAVFLSLAYHEGFGLPAAEAMACGAYVIGFDGFGGSEFFRPEFSSRVQSGDVVSFARTLEEVLERETRQPGWCGARGAAAARFIATEYSPAREREDVVDVYSSLIACR
jgi:hypothetical protein